MATGMQELHRYQSSDVRQPQRGERPCVRAVIHAEYRFDEIIGHSAALTIEHIPTEAMAELVHYDWPGNVRELQTVMERAVILAANGVLQPQVPTRSAGVRRASPVATMSETLDDAQRAHILDALRATNWVVAGPHGAATRLGMKRTTLLCRMAKRGIVRPLGLTPP